MRVITDKIGWRYVVPRRRYFRNLKIARHCPEIRGEVNRIALWNALDGITLAIMLPLALPSISIWAALDMFIDWLRSLRPDFSALCQDAVLDANEKLTPEQIRERLGEEASRILSKKTDA